MTKTRKPEGGQHRLRTLLVKSIKETDFHKFRWSNLDLTKILIPFSMLLHPVKACNEIKYENRGSVGLANIIAILFFLLSIVKRLAYGFIFNKSPEDVFNIWPIILQSIGMLLLWLISSWSLSTLLDGEGKLKEIWITVCYSMLPYVLLIPITVLLSHCLTTEESYFIVLLETVMAFWSVILLFASTMVVQQYSVSKTLLIMLFSVIGILCILFLTIMFFSLFQQLFIFLNSIFKEFLFRV